MVRITRAADCHPAWISNLFYANSAPASDSSTISCHFNMLRDERRSEDASFMKILDTTGQFLVGQPVVIWALNSGPGFMRKANGQSAPLLLFLCTMKLALQIIKKSQKYFQRVEAYCQDIRPAPGPFPKECFLKKCQPTPTIRPSILLPG